MLENAYYTRDVHGDFDLYDVGDLVLEEGMTLRGARLAYQTLGKLNEAKDNAILIGTWWSGNHSIMRDAYVGQGRALNPDSHFIILVNQLGSGLGSSPHNTAGPSGRGSFPRVRIGDDVRAQEQLIRDRFAIERLALIFGGSMGAEQGFEWAVRFPDKVARVAAMAGTARTTPHLAIFAQAMVDAIRLDQEFREGFYDDPADVRRGMALLARIWTILGLSREWFKQERWRDLGFSSREDLELNFILNYFRPMDPNALLVQAWKWQHADVSRHTGGDLAAALARITAKTYIMPISTDMFFPPEDCRADQPLIPGSELRVIESISGHASLFAFEQKFSDQLDSNLTELLSAPA
jgi:homoserine O-acetyltransferase/O-succinyltransferase